MYRTIKYALLTFLFSLSLAVAAQSPEEIQKLAAEGDAQAQARLGSMYLLGWQGFEQNDEKAAEWVEKAADQGVVDAQVMMGAMYDRGLGVPGDRLRFREARKLADYAAKRI